MPAINKPNQHFNTALWTANVANPTTGQKSISLGFQPDLVWSKNRDNAEANYLMDSVRGTAGNKWLKSNSTAVEGGEAAVGATDCYYNFTSTGFDIIDTNSGNGEVYYTNRTYVGWCWKAGGTAVTNTNGTISSQVSANPTAGFSIVAWTGNGVNSATVGHGLGAVPAMIICKERSGTDYWHIKHKSMSTNVNAFFQTNALYSAATVGDGVLADLSSNTTFGFATAGSPGNVVAVNENGVTNIAYCWSEIPGYSAFGSYTGNGSTDGPFIYTGFRPIFLMVKRTDNTTNDWAFLDGVRESYNVGIAGLKPNQNSQEYSGYNYRDLLSNGFKWRNGDSDINANGGTYIYAAWAEAPFKFANAR